MVNKIKQWLKKLSLKGCIILAAVVMAFSSFTVYYFSFDAKAHVLVCTGNYYLTDSQVYDLAKVSTNSRMYLTPSFVYTNRIEQMPLVKSASVSKSNGRLKILIKEKNVIGYYVKGNKNYMLTIDNESIPLEEKYLKLIIHFPLLNGFTAQQRKDICAQFKKNKKVLNRAVIEKIAEMVPYKTSYDKNMIKMTMQDGNVVYTSLSSLVMMANYQAMLTQLQGENVCLLLDASNSAIEKVDCNDVSSTTKKKSKKKSSKKESKKTEDTTETDDSEWQEDSETGLEYNATTGHYRDPSTKEEYVWNEETQTFDAVNSSDSTENSENTYSDSSQDYTDYTYNEDYSYTDDSYVDGSYYSDSYDNGYSYE